MKVQGSVVVDRPPAELFEELLDPEVLRSAIPGCERLEKDGDDTYRVELKAGLGMIKGRFRGTVRLADVKPPESYRLLVDAKGTTGFINGATRIELVPVDGGERTEVRYEGEAKVGGVIASVGARLFQGAARAFADQFFDALKKL